MQSTLFWFVNTIFLQCTFLYFIKLYLKDHVTEDWSNDVESSALHHRKKIIFKSILENRKLIIKIVIIYHNITFFCIFDQRNAALVSIKNSNVSKLSGMICICVHGLYKHTYVVYIIFFFRYCDLGIIPCII